MAEVPEQIREFLRNLEGESSFDLAFSYNGTDYNATFKASHKGAGTEREVIEVENGCINMTFGYTTSPPDKPEEQTFVHGFVGGIKAEDGIVGKLLSPDGKSACFQPILTTNGRNTVRKSGKRTTSGDVLQILKSKLGLAFPVKEIPIALIDGARNEPPDVETGSPTMISPFHIARGGNAYYEKYGYRSSKITELKTAIRSVTWGDCTDPIKKVVHACTKKEYEDDKLLTSIMTDDIPWETERAYNEKNRPSLSSTVVRQFALSKMGIPLAESHQWTVLKNIWTFQLDTDSEDWKRCDAELVLTGFLVGGAKPVGGAGKRRTRQKPRKGTRSGTRRGTKRR
jgi:hypothetical protein